jgi:polyhydroxyalkanoate synthesis regulator phasin
MAKKARTDADALTGELEALKHNIEVLKQRHEVELREAVQAAVVRRIGIVERLMPTKAQRGLDTHPHATLVTLAMLMGHSCEEDPILNMLSDVDSRTIMAEAAKVDVLDDKVERLAKRLEFLKNPHFSDACPICCAAYAPQDGDVRICPECKSWMCQKCAIHKSHGAGLQQHQC